MFDGDFPIGEQELGPKCIEPDAQWLAQLCACLPHAKDAYLWINNAHRVNKLSQPLNLQPTTPIANALNHTFAEHTEKIEYFTRDEEELALITCPVQIDSSTSAPFRALDTGMPGAIAVVFPKFEYAQLEALAKLIRNNLPWRGLLHSYAGAANFLNVPPSARSSDIANEPILIARLLASSLTQDNPASCAFNLVNELADVFSCERVIVTTIAPKQSKILAISGISEADPRQQCNRAAAMLMNKLQSTEDALIGLDSKIDNEHEAALAEYRQATQTTKAAAVTFTAKDGSRLGAIFEWCETSGALTGNASGTISTVTRYSLGLLALQIAAVSPPSKMRKPIGLALTEKIFGNGHLKIKISLSAILLAGLLATFVPVDFRISAPITLEGATQRAIVAPYEGYVKTAHVQAGMTVKAEQILVELDESKLILNQEKWISEKNKLSREYDAALAELNQAQAQIIRAQIGQAEAELNLVNNEISRATLAAPFDGVVISGDLSRSLGAPLERGEVLFEIAPLDGYRVVLSVDERDIAKIAHGQIGELTLNALPGLRWPFEITNVASATPSKDGKRHFRVEATLAEPSEKLRPGMQGLGKVTIGEQSLAYIVTRRFVGWLQLNLWSKLP